MFYVKEHVEFSEACFERFQKPENRDLCISVDLNTLPSEYGKALIRIVMDGMTNADGKEAVELAAPMLYQYLIGPMMAVSRKLALYIEDCSENNLPEDVILAHISNSIHAVLLDGLDRINRGLCNSSNPKPYCTISVAVVFYRHIYTANMGDSPIYLMDLNSESKELLPLFVCDNEAAELIAVGALTEETALHSQAQNHVRRFLGYKGRNLLEDSEIHFRVTPLPQTSVLLIGSDGALSQLTRRCMGKVIEDNICRDLDAVMQELQHMVEESGSVDDFTLLMDYIESD